MSYYNLLAKTQKAKTVKELADYFQVPIKTLNPDVALFPQQVPSGPVLFRKRRR